MAVVELLYSSNASHPVPIRNVSRFDYRENAAHSPYDESEIG